MPPSNKRGVHQLNVFTIIGDEVEMDLTRDKSTTLEFKDWLLVSKYRWIAHSRGYGFYVLSWKFVGGKRLVLRMHREIMNTTGEVDHIDHNPLNNRRSNLRLASRTENVRNTGPRAKNKLGYKGVDRVAKGYRAQIQADKKKINIGTFETLQEAIEHYDMASLAHHGEYGYLNFPDRREEYLKRLAPLIQKEA
jgi:hypothetical protein